MCRRWRVQNLVPFCNEIRFSQIECKSDLHNLTQHAKTSCVGLRICAASSVLHSAHREGDIAK